MMSEGTNQVAGPGQDIRDNQDDFDPVNASASGVIDDLPAWILSLTAVARTGLAFSDSLYERERYEEILKVVARMQEAAGARDRGVDTSVFAEGPRGIPGYVTPKTAVGAIVLDASRRVLLIRRADSGVWLYPTGWADVGYSPAEVVVKEVQEETGVHCTPTHLLAVLDGMRLGFTQVAMYSSIFLCRADGGELTPHPLETSGVAWFEIDDLPANLRTLFAAPWLAWIRDRSEPPRTYFDPVRPDRV
ncbi:NUDIX hydrolase N-terminal domain-containing protein [Ferrimicrobium acidiphilum]|uniref:NUDIX hydrolase N-terminal domain-containing protein n=2 Tax=Ferrimicrobium acidiphilum TaxID=121039 RepID=UPI0023F1B846|nr:NUDIX hydrolase N-terminal domain-containing protein [Ferrimicrobium acidiphilum]